MDLDFTKIILTRKNNMLYRIINFIRSLFYRLVPDKTQSPVVTVPIPVITGVNFTLGEIKGASQEQIRLAKDSFELFLQIILSPQFKDEILKSTFTSNNGMTNEEIYHHYLDSKATINIQFFYGSFYQNRIAKTVGYDLPNDDFVYVNKYFVNSRYELTSLISHELAHSCGFSHQSASESTSVPYAFGRIFKTIMNQLGVV